VEVCYNVINGSKECNLTTEQRTKITTGSNNSSGKVLKTHGWEETPIKTWKIGNNPIRSKTIGSNPFHKRGSPQEVRPQDYNQPNRSQKTCFPHGVSSVIALKLKCKPKKPETRVRTHPVYNARLEEDNNPSHPTLNDIPNEVLAIIMSY
jgi:hypothetical protein